MTDRYTKSGVEKRLVRKLQKLTGANYTTCLRKLEAIPDNDLRRKFVDFVKSVADLEKPAEPNV